MRRGKHTNNMILNKTFKTLTAGEILVLMGQPYKAQTLDEELKEYNDEQKKRISSLQGQAFDLK